MFRLIDADDLKDWSEIVPLTEDGGIDINDFEEKLKSMPTIDAVPVVRCGVCLRKRYCSFYRGDDDDFCSWAEGKDHGTD